MSKILLIGGTDPSGAGLQTDWKIIHAMNMQASSIITAVTAQSQTKVRDTGVLTAEHFSQQLATQKQQVFSVIKIGMLGNEKIIETLAPFLKTQNKDTAIILDPVLISSSGGALLNSKGQAYLLSLLLPYTTLITPNINELSLLTHLPVNNTTDITKAAKQLIKQGANAVFVKGGHFLSDQPKSYDFFISQHEQFYLEGERWKNRKNVRGTGCALATAIASSIAQGYCLTDSLIIAKSMISQGIRKAKKADEQGKNHQLQFNQQKNHFKGKDLAKLIHTLTPESPALNFPDCGSKTLGIYPVVNSLEWIKKLVPLGIETIQLRIKNKTDNEVEAIIKAAIEYCRNYPTRLFINDYWQLAIKHQAYGIHLGQEDIETANLHAIAESGCRLGLSTHSFTEVARAHAIKPSYLALGPIFATTSKDMPWIPQGVDSVKKWVKLLGDAYPLVAIGGINIERAKALKKTGVGSVAMISAITHADNYQEKTRELLNLWDETC